MDEKVTLTAADLHRLQHNPAAAADELALAAGASAVQMHAGELDVLQKAADSPATPALPVAAGIALLSADSGRILMLQRAPDPTTCPCGMALAWGMDGGDWWSHADGSISHDGDFDQASVSELVGTEPPDPAAGRWEFPGGCLEAGESPLQAAMREWSEETGCDLPTGQVTGQWASSNGKYTGFVYEVASEADVPIFDGRDAVINPDDPDGDATEALAWWDPSHLPDNPAVRDELAADLDQVLAAITDTDPGGQDEASKAAIPATVLAIAAHLHKAGDPQALRNWYNSGAAGGVSWGSHGDFDACVQIAGRYVDDPEGFCALRHHDATGQWPGRRAHGKSAQIPGLTKRSGMISLDVPPGTIPVAPGGVDDHHITIVYLGKDVDDDAFANACERAKAAGALLAGPLTGAVSGRGTFAPSAGSDGKTPVFAEVELPGINVLNNALKDLSASEHTAYHPHVTLAFADDGDPLPDPVPYTPVTFTHIAVHRGPQILTFPLGPQPADPLTGKAAGTRPKASSRATKWPGWGPDQAAAAYWTPRIEAAFHAALPRSTATELARAYRDSGLGARNNRSNAELTAAALAWLTTRKLNLADKLRTTLRRLHTDGRAIGAASAAAVLDESDLDLGDWEPGETAAAEQLLEAADADSADAFGNDTDARADQIARTHLGRVARALAIGVASGLGITAIAATILNAAAASARGISLTEIFTAAARAAFGLYRRRQVQYGRWLASPGSCPRCRANQAAGILPLGAIYPGGTPAPPQHPNCGCALLPAAQPAP